MHSGYDLRIDIFIFGYRGGIIIKKRKKKNSKKGKRALRYPNPVIFLTLYL